MNETTALDERFLDRMEAHRNCPGFNLYDVLGTDCVRYLVAADYPGGVQVRVYMQSNGAVDVAECTLIGANPAVAEWEAAR